MVDRHIAMTKKHYPGAFVSPTTFGVVKIDLSSIVIVILITQAVINKIFTKKFSRFAEYKRKSAYIEVQSKDHIMLC